MVKLTSLNGNSQLLDGGAMFGNAPKALWSRWTQPDELGRIPLACRSLYVEIDGIKILLETGIGAFFEPKMAERFGVQNPSKLMLIDSMQKLSIDPDEIDFVILSHLHFDHAGGLLASFEDSQKGNNELNFKTANYVVGAEALRRSENPHLRDRASFIPELNTKLKDSGRLLVIDEGATGHNALPNNIEFIYSHGHTPGQMLTKVNGTNESVIFTGDLVPGTHWVNLPITMGYDRFAEKVIDEKQNLYASSDLKKTWMFYTHDISTAMSKVQLNEKGRFEPTQKTPEFVDMEI